VKAAALLVCSLLASATASAQSLSVSASVNNTRVALGDQIALSVAITGSGSAVPRMPPIADVEVYESGRSQSMTMINGSVNTSVTFTYVLAPRKAGKFRVPPIEVAGAAPTEPIDIEVLAAGVAPPPRAAPNTSPAPRPGEQAPAVFVTAALQKKHVFVNEQVLLVVRFLTAMPLMGQPRYDAPKLIGLLSENLGSEGQGTTSIGGRLYNYSEIKSALFPVQAGHASVGQAVVTVQVPRQQTTGDAFFDRFFGMTAPETRRLTSDPLDLQVDPLPPGKPDDFSGVVGRLTIEASLDKTQVKAGEAVNLIVSVRGTGNIKSLPEPKRPDLPSARFFDSESSFTLDRVGDKVGGTKVFRTVLVPRVSGPLEIPPLTLSFFDDEKRAYVQIKSAPLRLRVLPGDPNAAQPLVGPGGNASAPGVTAVAEDIAYLKPPKGPSWLGDALAAFGATGPHHAPPFLFFLAAVLYDWRRRRHLADPRSRRARQARAAAERRLREAESCSEADRARAVNLLAEAVSGYFSDKLGLSVAGLTLKTVAERLSGSPHLARLKPVWEELDLLRFAPNAANQAEIVRLTGEIRALTLALDKELRP
jgi:hypothetical protein